MSTRNQRHKHPRTETFAAEKTHEREEPGYLLNAPPLPTMADVYAVMTLTDLRHIASQRGVRPNGLRPSKAIKADVVAALLANAAS